MNNFEDKKIIFPLLINNQKEKQLDDFFDKILFKIKNKDSFIVVDMTNLNSINSSILAKLLYYSKKTTRYGGKLKLINIKDSLKKILVNLKFDSFFIIE